MIFQRMDQGGSKWSGIAAVAALISLATSWALHTPELSKKADRLDVVETHDVPRLKSEIGCLHVQATVAKNVAKQAVVSANSDTVQTPDLKVIPNCPPPSSVAKLGKR